jgi:hypothetical protein
MSESVKTRSREEEPSPAMAPVFRSYLRSPYRVRAARRSADPVPVGRSIFRRGPILLVNLKARAGSVQPGLPPCRRVHCNGTMERMLRVSLI